ncbi:MAG: hypothetical protein FJW20_14515 [Acidimicrobiia bacterium]|nr:hypothetical protein [Acidimicrobiia bacterium]
MLLAGALLLLFAVLFFVFWLGPKDLPEPEPESPTAHLEERKARIYEGLRDLQFEFRLGKLSDEDYQRTKLGLQTELAGVLAQIDKLTPRQAQPKPEELPKPDPNQCPHCNARFPQPLKFCGECGKPMAEAAS